MGLTRAATAARTTVNTANSIGNFTWQLLDDMSIAAENDLDAVSMSGSAINKTSLERILKGECPCRRRTCVTRTAWHIACV